MTSVPPRVLFAHHTKIDYMAPPQLSARQITCGPYCPEVFESGFPRFLNTKLGHYDIEDVIRRIPREDFPSFFIAKSDASRSNFPRHLHKLKIPKVLILGDTQHMYRPLETMLEYVEKEKYDYLITDHKRHHLHFFSEIFKGPILWAPALFFTSKATVTSPVRNLRILFGGNVFASHATRRARLTALQAEVGANLYVTQVGQREYHNMLSCAQVGLNHSLNGDMNLRTVEVPFHGAALLTDRLSPFAGLDELFEDGRDYIGFSSEQELLTVARELIRDPRAANEIALSGQAKARRLFGDRGIPKRLMRFLTDRAAESWMLAIAEPRVRYKSNWTSPFGTYQRARIYQVLQAEHLKRGSLEVVLALADDTFVALELSDLPNATINVWAEADVISASRARLPPEVIQRLRFWVSDREETPSGTIAVTVPEVLQVLFERWSRVGVLPEMILVVCPEGNGRRSQGLEAGFWIKAGRFGYSVSSDPELTHAVGSDGFVLTRSLD